MQHARLQPPEVEESQLLWVGTRRLLLSLGLALAGAVAFGYSNIFVTSPSPENLKTLFEFVVKGFDALGYEV